MRIACVLIEHFAAAVSELRWPQLQGTPFVVGGQAHERKPVYDASPAAVQLGISPGMSLREASQRCPQASFLPLRSDMYEQAFQAVIEALLLFTPRLKPASLGCIYLDLRQHTLPPRGEPQLAEELLVAVRQATGLEAQVSIARGVFCAQVAAQVTAPGEITVVAAGEEEALLQPLPVSFLPLSAEALRRLTLLGIHQISDLAALSEEAARLQLGAEGRNAWRLARGQDERRLAPWRQERQLSEEREFDTALVSNDQFVLATRHLVDQLLPRLQGERLYCSRALLQLWFEGGEERTLNANFREPSQDSAVICRNLERVLLAAPYSAGIARLRLSLCSLGGCASRQLTLFTPRQGKLALLQATAGHLRESLQGGRLYRALLTDRNAALPERRFILVDYQ